MNGRILVFRRLVLMALGLLVLRLGHLQLVHGAAYRRRAEDNRLRLIPQSAPRGLIMDRRGRRIAATRTDFRLAAVPQDLMPRAPASRFHRASEFDERKPQEVFARLSQLVDRPSAALEREFKRSRSLPFLPATLVERLPKSLALRVEEQRLRLPGIMVESVTTRAYPLGPVAAHLIGSIGVPTAEAYPALKEYGVRPQDLVGRSGLERELDAYLRGRSGGSLIEVDHRARQVRVIGYRQPVPGEPVVLTIDAELQALIERQFGEQPGACVVLRPQTGELLAMVSSPGFDPAVFAAQDQEVIGRLLTDPQAPLMNRATLGIYLPGSIVKPITAMTALEERVIDPTTPMHCPGYLTIGDRQFHCWNRDGHGDLTVHDALMQSCNVFFMQMGRRLGLVRLRAGFMRAGFGRRTGWMLDEQPGHLPEGRHFSEGEVAMLAMGQGEILITPLQAAVMVSAIANGGWLVEPWVVQEVGQRPMGRPHLVPTGWSRRNLAVVRSGMEAVVNDPQGTGIRAHSERVRIAGKTGTAQTHLPGRTHGWFVGFCPVEQPAAAIAIVAEYGGSGGDVPATIAKAICEYLAEPPESPAAPAPSRP